MTDEAAKVLGVLLILIFAILIIVFGPLVTIWSLNTLFHLNIEYSFWTWLAMAWLGGVLSASKFKNKE